MFLRQRREEIGLSQGEVAFRSGRAFDASTLSKVETGKIGPSAELLTAIAPILRLEVPYLYRLAGLWPETTEVREPEPPKSVSWPEIEEMIRHSQDLTLEQKRDLIAVWKVQYDAMAQVGTERKRRAPRKASG